MSRFLPILSIGLLISGLLTLFTPLFANAASDYDSVISTVDKLKIDTTKSYNSTRVCEDVNNFDFTSNYFGGILQAEKDGTHPEPEVFMNAWKNRPESAVWRIMNNQAQFTFVLFEEDPQYQAYTDSYGTKTFRPTKNTRVATFTYKYEMYYNYSSALCGQLNEFGFPKSMLYVESSGWNEVNWNNEGNRPLWFTPNQIYENTYANSPTEGATLLFTGEIEYPNDYEGEKPADSVEIKPIKNKHFPVVAWNYNGDKNINATTIYNENQICIKNTNYACFDGEMTIQYKLYDGFSGETIDEKMIEHWQRYDSPEIELDKTYYLGVKYVPKIEIPLAPIYDELSEIKFLIESDRKMKSGSNYTVKCENSGDSMTCEDAPLLENCLKEDAPWIDLNGCIKNMNKIVESLSFGQIKFFNVRYSYNNIGGCQELYPIPTIGSWLNLKPGERYVCPVFKKEIIDIVTPFITVTLGLVLVKFLTRIGRNDND